MSDVQESDTDGDRFSAVTVCAVGEGLRPTAGEVKWDRTDWDSPVGFFTAMLVVRKRSEVRGMVIEWVRVEFPRIQLAHKAALLLLQGQALSAILIPNHVVRYPHHHGTRTITTTVGHVLLRCDPWDYTLAVPELTGVVIAKLGEIPDGVSAAETLAALAHDSAT